LIEGPNKSLENNPSQITLVLQAGFDCEVDLWIVQSELWLGHDEPQYLVNEKFIKQIGLWVHAKNLAALRWLRDTDCNYFWHETDAYTLTSHKFIWTYPGKELTTVSVMVMPEMFDPTLTNIAHSKCYGVCSDFINKIKEKYDNLGKL
jgi:hypothetical protein